MINLLDAVLAVGFGVIILGVYGALDWLARRVRAARRPS